MFFRNLDFLVKPIIFVLIFLGFSTSAFAAYSDGFIFPVLASGQTDPVKNTSNPIGNGWSGNAIGWSGSIGSGHLGQDYYILGACNDGNDQTVGKPVFAVSNGKVVQTINNPNTQYGWDDGLDHGWGRVIVVEHILPAGFNADSTTMLTETPNELNPKKIYSLYGHLKKDSIVVTVGNEVTKGQKIAEIGDGGIDVSWTCSHLHFELKNASAYSSVEYAPKNNINAFCCGSQPTPGIGFGYSGIDDSAPNRYRPNEFITKNKVLDKALIQLDGGSDIYWLQNNKLYRVVSPDIIDSMGEELDKWSFTELSLASSFDSYTNTSKNFITLNESSNGILIKQVNTDAIYVINNGVKEYIPSPEDFNNSGYNWADIIEVSQSIFDMFTTSGGVMTYAVGEGASSEDIRQTIIDTYNSFPIDLGSATGTVSGPISASTGTTGYYQSFSNGSIQYISNGTNAGLAYAVYGDFYKKWGELGFANSPLGFPTDNQNSTVSSFGTAGDYQTFENGSIQENGSFPFSVFDEIYQKWGQINFANSPLGFPIGDRVDAKSSFGTGGQYQRFQGGSIQINSFGAFVVYGKIYVEWGQLGYAGPSGYEPGDAIDNGQLTWVGFPVSARYSCNTGECQDFEGGFIEDDGVRASFVSTTHPINLSADIQTDNSVLLSWENRISASGVKVYRYGSPTENLIVLGPNVTSFTDTTRQLDHTYTYFIQAVNETAESSASNEIIINSSNSVPWPMFHQNIFHTGQSIHTGPENPMIKWQYPTGGFSYSSPAVDDNGVIYVGSSNRYLYAINPEGSLKWRYLTGGGVTSSPAIDGDGTVYVGSDDSYLYAINPDGTLKWRYQTDRGGVYSSPTIDGNGTVYVGSGDYYLYAINPDGTLKWRYYTGGIIYSSPAIDGDGTVYVGSNDYYLYAINPDGTLKWRYNSRGTIVSSPAIGQDGTIYVGSISSYLYALNPDGTLKWQFWLGSYRGIFSSPAISNEGTIYVGSGGSNGLSFYAFNPDGTQKWRYDIGAGIQSSPAIDANGTVYFGSDDGYFYVLNPDGTLKWRIQTGNIIDSSPAIASDGTVYVHSRDSYLYAITHFPGVIGAIFDTVNNSPIPNVTVMSNTGEITQSDANGNYQLQLSPGVYTITFSSNDYQTVKMENIVVEEGPSTKLSVTLFKSLSGSILDLSTDNAISGVNVFTDTGESTVSDPQGYFSFGNLSPGIYNINFTHNSYQTITINDVLIQESQATKLNVSLFKSLSGVIRDISSNALISGVTVSTNNGTSTVTDQQGYYNLGDLSPGVYNITFSHTGYQTTIINNVIVQEGQPTTLDTYLTIPGFLNITSTSPLPPAEIGVDYNERVKITGGTYPYIFSVAYGVLPPGLLLDPAFGNIIGTPTIPGSYTFGIGVRDIQNYYAENEFTIEVAQPLAFETESILPRGTINQPHFFSFEASGGTKPYTFWGYLRECLGRRLDRTCIRYESLSLSSDGIISGTAEIASIRQFTVQVTDDSGRTASKEFVLEFDNPLTINTTQLNNGIVGQPFNQQLSATGGYGNYSWNVYAGSLPDGITLNSNGDLTGTPNRSTNGTIVLSVIDEYGRQKFKDYNFLVVDPLIFVTSSLPTGHTGSSYSELIITHGGVGPFTYSYEGQLPEGLSLNTSTGIISGIPTTAKFVNLMINVTDSTWPTSQTVSQIMSIRTTSMLTVTTSAVLPSVKKGDTLTPIILSAGGGISPYSWDVASGYLAAGLTLDSTTGILSGTPAAGGDYIFTLRVTDSTGATAEKEFFLTVYPDLKIVTNVVQSGGVGKPYNFILEAKGGKAPYSWRLVSGTLPYGLSLSSSRGIIGGNPTTRQSFQFTVEVSDADSPAQAVQKTYSIEVYDELFIETTGLINGRIDEAYTAKIKASLGVPPYIFRISEGVLPPGLTLSSTTESATISGTPTTPGDYTFTVEVMDTGTPVAIASRTYSITIYGELTIDTVGLTSTYRGQPYSDTILVSGGALPYTWQITSGTLPAGLSLNRATGAVTGITQLVEGQSSTFTIRVTEGKYPYGYIEKEFVIYVITPIAIETTTIQNAMQNLAYSATLTGTGGVSPYTWTVNVGSLPDGVTIDSGTGIIFGSPANCGPFDFTVNLADSAQLTNTAKRAYHIDVICESQPDYDNDGIPDGIEDRNDNGVVDQGETDPFDSDSDDDGIPDGIEDINQNGIVDLGETKPTDIDTDSDGIYDGTELGYILNDIGPDTDINIFQPDFDPSTQTDPLNFDTDDDGISDGVEDSNQNGVLDAEESDPLDPNDPCASVDYFVVNPHCSALASSDTDRVVFFDASQSDCYEMVTCVKESRVCNDRWDFGGEGGIVGGNGDNIVVYQYDTSEAYTASLTMTEQDSGTEVTENLTVIAEIVQTPLPAIDFATEVSLATLSLTIEDLDPTDSDVVTSVIVFWGDRYRTEEAVSLPATIDHTYTRTESEYHIRVKAILADGGVFHYTFMTDEDLTVSIP